jgi:hypothetical protein
MNSTDHNHGDGKDDGACSKYPQKNDLASRHQPLLPCTAENISFFIDLKG